MRWLDQKASSKTYSACLQTIRLLSRDKAGLDTLMTSDVLATLVRHSGLDGYSQSQGELITNQQGDPNGRLRKEVFFYVFILFQQFLLTPISFYLLTPISFFLGFFDIPCAFAVNLHISRCLLFVANLHLIFSSLSTEHAILYHYTICLYCLCTAK